MVGELPPVQCCNAFTLYLDAQTAISFLKTYGLDKDFKVSNFQITNPNCCFEDLFLTLLERYYPRANALVDGNSPHLQLNIEPNHTTLAGHGHEHDVVLASK